MCPLPKLRDLKDESDGDFRVFSEMDHVVKPQRRFLKYLVFLVAFAALAGGLWYSYDSYLNQPTTTIALDRVTIGQVTVSSFSESIPVSGIVVPLQTVFLDTVEGGRVTNIFVEDGAQVSLGDELIALKNVDLELQVVSREAQYTNQLSGLAQARIAYDRSILQYDRDLMSARLQIDLTRASLERRLPREETGVSQSEIDRLEAELAYQMRIHEMLTEAKQRDSENAKRDLTQLEVSVESMSQSLELLRASLADLTIKAPINGQLSAFQKRIGEYVSPGERVGQIDQTGSFKVRATVGEFYLGRFEVGQTAGVSIGNTNYRLGVTKIYPNVDNRQFEIDLEFTDAPPQSLRRGQNLRLRIELSEDSEVLTVPNGPFYEQTGGRWIFVVSDDGSTAHRRLVSLGRRNATEIEVVSGLIEGERVLTSSYAGLENAESVKLQ